MLISVTSDLPSSFYRFSHILNIISFSIPSYFVFLLNPRSSWNTTKHFIRFLLSSNSTFLWCLSALPLFPSLLCFFSVVGASQKKGLCLFSQYWMSIKEVLAREIRIEKGMLFITTSEETIVLPWRCKSAIDHPIHTGIFLPHRLFHLQLSCFVLNPR